MISFMFLIGVPRFRRTQIVLEMECIFLFEDLTSGVINTWFVILRLYEPWGKKKLFARTNVTVFDINLLLLLVRYGVYAEAKIKWEFSKEEYLLEGNTSNIKYRNPLYLS